MEQEVAIEGQDDRRVDSPRAGAGWRRWREPAALALLALAINLVGNDRTGLWDRDEPRYAVAVREMRARGDWFLPTYNGEPRYHKPILIYWLMGLTTALGGDNPFGARLASSLAGAAAVVGVWWLGRRLLGPRGGRLAGLIYATAPIIAVESKLATTDATLALWLLGAQASLWVLSRRDSRLAVAGFWAALNLAILTKGPVGPALVATASGVAWWCGWPVPSRERLRWRWGLASLLLVSAPWFAAVSIASGGEFLRFAVGDQLLRRVAVDRETHGGFPGYYPTVATLVFFPWSTLIPAAVAGAWARRRSQPALAYLLGWSIGPMILLECSRTKLIHYYLPAFPSWALLAGWLILSLADEGVNIRRRPLGRLAMGMLVGMGLAIAAVLIAGAVFLPGRVSVLLVVVAALVAGSALVGMARFQRGEGRHAAHVLAACWAAILVIATGAVVPMCEPFRTSRIVGEHLRALAASTGLEPVMLEYQEPGVVYALGYPIAETRDPAGFFSHLTGGRSVLTALRENEIEVMREHFGLEVTPVERVEGFWLTKGKYQTLFLSVVKQGASRSDGEAAPIATAGGAAGEQTLVK